MMLRKLLDQCKSSTAVMKKPLKNYPIKKIQPASTPEELETVATDESVVSNHNNIFREEAVHSWW